MGRPFVRGVVNSPSWAFGVIHCLGQFFDVLLNPSPFPVLGLIPDLSVAVGVGQFFIAVSRSIPLC